MNKALASACLLVLLLPWQGRAEDEKPALSPDGRWQYQLVDGHWPEIHRTRDGQRVLDLNGPTRSVPHADGREVAWSPDSKRFAFNYDPPHVPHSTYVTTAIYQLRGDEWVLLKTPIDEDSPEDSFAVLARHLPKGVRPPRVWRTDPNRLVFKVSKWVDADTAVLYVHAAEGSSGEHDASSSFLFTLKFDPAGKCEVISARKATSKDIED
ncbi:MAG: hypothetical protein ABI883_00220 [Chthoniobacterales bacterium]